jgi:hypothetical protein
MKNILYKPHSKTHCLFVFIFLLFFLFFFQKNVGNKWNSPPGEMGRFGSLKVPSQLGPNRSSVGDSTHSVRRNVVPIANSSTTTALLEREEK